MPTFAESLILGKEREREQLYEQIKNQETGPKK